MKIAAVLLCLAAICCGQKPAEPAEVPIDQEPHHHLVFENEYVRVFKVEVAPHEATLVHRHTRDYVVVTIGDAEVTNAVVGKEPKKWNFKDGDVTFLEATKDKSFAHKAVNEAGTTFVNYTIELKRTAIGEDVRCGFTKPACSEKELLYSSVNMSVRERKDGSSFIHECGDFPRPCLLLKVIYTNTGTDSAITWQNKTVPRCFEGCGPDFYLEKGRTYLGRRDVMISFASAQ